MSTAFLLEIECLHARGWALVPVPLRRKRPVTPGWQHLRLDDTGLRTAFRDRSNVGVLLGEPSNGLTDVDLDCPEALALAPHFLPLTDLRSGRPSAPASHAFYRVPSPIRTIRFRDPRLSSSDERSMLIELRSTGSQTLIPPSIHPSGEKLVWERDGEPTEVEAEVLQRAVSRIATASLLARAWPNVGSRHDAALALAGGLLRAGWPTHETAEFVWHIATVAGDEEANDRRRAVLSTADSLAVGQHTTGWPTLTAILDSRVVIQIQTWLGIGDQGNATSSYETRVTAPNGGVAPSPITAEQQARAIPVPLFPLHVFPPLVERYLAQGTETIGCPPDLLAVPFLGYAAAAIGNRRRLALKRRWVRKATLWSGVIAASGEGKSPADAYARTALDLLQNTADHRFQEQYRAYKRELSRWKSADSSSRGDEPAPPAYEHWYTTDPTVESLAPMLQGNAGVAAAFDELVAWARGCNAYKRGGNDRQKYLEVWNGRSLKVDRRTQEVLNVPDPVLCIVGGIQPDRLPELTREASVHDGLLPRFCWTYPDVTPGDWDWEESEADELDEIVALFQLLRIAPMQTIRPHPDARERWATWYDDTKRGRAALPPLAREVASKLPAHLATLWLVLHCLWDPKGRQDQAGLQNLERAIEVVEYFRAHARRVLVHFGTNAPHVDAGLTGRVAAILRRADRWLSKTELWDALHRNAKAEALDAALGALLAEGRVLTRTEGHGPGATTLWRWCAAPESYEANDAERKEEPPSVWDAEEDALDSYEATNRAEASRGTTSFTSYEVGRSSQVPRPPKPVAGRCYACGGTRFADDGVCLICHPRSWLRHEHGVA